MVEERAVGVQKVRAPIRPGAAAGAEENRGYSMGKAFIGNPCR